jgi:hypothetical protein
MVRRSASSMLRDDVVFDEELGSERIQIKNCEKLRKNGEIRLFSRD